jgi:aerobic C4-dicarboxylate transport protein
MTAKSRYTLANARSRRSTALALAPQTIGRKLPIYRTLYFQVLVGIVLAIIFGNFYPDSAINMKPLGDMFIKLIKMMIGLVVFCTVVSGIAGMGNMKKVGRVGGKALLYFEIVSTIALLLGMLVGNVVHPGTGFNADPAKLDTKAIAQYAGAAKEHSGLLDFIGSIIPNTAIDAFARGDILPIVLVSILVGYAVSALGEKARPVRDLVDAATRVVFAVINVVMRLAPIGAFGAMAFTVGRYGIRSLGPLLELVGVFYLTGAVFVVVVLGAISAWAGFNIFKLLNYIKAELLLTLGTSSSDPALPTLMEKLERAGCSRPVVSLVVPTGYVFNSDGSNIYLTLAALFVAQATNTPLSLEQQAALFGVALLTSKGSGGVTGAGFIALVATLSVVPSVPLAGMALILGIDRFMSEARAIVNIIGNAVATIVMARIEGELDTTRLRLALSGQIEEDPSDLSAAIVAAGGG